MDVMRQSGESERALLEWINSFPLQKRVVTFNDLNDGHTIWEVLCEIDPNHFTGGLPEGAQSSGKWVTRVQNLKKISKLLQSYLANTSRGPLAPGPNTADLEKLAREGAISEWIKLLTLVLAAAIESPAGQRRDELVRRLGTIGESAGTCLMEIYQEMREPIPKAPTVSYVAQSPEPPIDEILLIEAKYYEASARATRFEAENKDLATNHGQLQRENESLREDLVEAEGKLQVNDSAQRAEMESKVKEMSLKVEQQEDLIRSQETAISELEVSKGAIRDDRQKTAEKLNAEKAKSSKLEDEIDITKTERDDFAKKANTGEKYRQKLQAVQQENKELRDSQEDLYQRAESGDETRNQIRRLQLTIDEYKRTLPKIEHDYHDLQIMKRQLELDNATLVQRCEKLEEHRAQDQEKIKDFVEQGGELDNRQTSSGHEGDLETELADSAKTEAQLQVVDQLSRLSLLTKSYRRSKIVDIEAEYRRLQTTADEYDTQNRLLHQELKDTNDRRKELEEKYLETYQEKLLLESSLASVNHGNPIQGFGPSDLKARSLTHNLGSTDIFQKKCDQLNGERRKRAEVEGQLLEKIRECNACQQSLALVDMDQLQIIDEVKKQNSATLTELQNQHRLLRQRAQDLEIELDEHKKLLRSGMDRSTLVGGSEASNQDLKEALEAIKAATAGRPTSAVEKGNDAVDKLASKVIDARERLAKRAEHIKKQNATIKNLEDRLQQQPPRTTDVTPGLPDQIIPSSSQQAYTKNLEREIKLMATAYHDLAGRLQMTNVVLQRRSDTETSWLNKQRRLVEQTIPGRSL